MRRFSLNGKYEYCPNGNHWQEVSSIFDEALYLFCDCNKCKGQVYKLKAFNVTKKISKESIKRIREDNKIDEVKSKITYANIDKVLQVINKD